MEGLVCDTCSDNFADDRSRRVRKMMRTQRKGLQPTKIRRQYQRDFLHWLSEKRDQFVIKPLKPKATVHYVSLRFPDMLPIISIKIFKNEIMVIVTWENRFFDMLLDLDMYPVWSGNGYRCKLCDGSETIFPDLTVMRSDHLYQPFLEWCNAQFLNSRWLKMVTTIGGSSGAILLRELDSPGNDAVINLFLGLKKLNGQPACTKDELRVFHLPLFEVR